LTDYRTLSMLVHAPSKTGKTTLAATAPGPTVVLDAEGGWKWIAGALNPNTGEPYRRVDWNPTEAPPGADGSWDFCVVTVRNWETVQTAYTWLASPNHGFTSFVMDSVTEIQRRCKANLRGTEAMKIQDWGTLLTQMDNTIRGFRDLTLTPDNPIKVAIFVAESKQAQTGKVVPSMQGQIGNSLPYWMDVVGYLYAEQEADENGQPHGPKVRKLLVAQNDSFEAGERVQGRIGPIVTNPNLTDIMKTIYPGTGE